MSGEKDYSSDDLDNLFEGIQMDFTLESKEKAEKKKNEEINKKIEENIQGKTEEKEDTGSKKSSTPKDTGVKSKKSTKAGEKSSSKVIEFNIIKKIDESNQNVNKQLTETNAKIGDLKQEINKIKSVNNKELNEIVSQAVQKELNSLEQKIADLIKTQTPIEKGQDIILDRDTIRLFTFNSFIRYYDENNQFKATNINETIQNINELFSINKISEYLTDITYRSHFKTMISNKFLIGVIPTMGGWRNRYIISKEIIERDFDNSQKYYKAKYEKEYYKKELEDFLQKQYGLKK